MDALRSIWASERSGKCSLDGVPAAQWLEAHVGDRVAAPADGHAWVGAWTTLAFGRN